MQTTDGRRCGPLTAYTVVELGGIGPGPFAAMVLADLGADVIRVDRPPGGEAIGLPAETDLLRRGRRSLVLDLKTADGQAAFRRLAARADVVIDPFRPGVAERLRIGPQDCGAHNPRLVYARITGWGQDGPLAAAAGHDINYLALSGALAAIGRRNTPPPPPLTLVGDFGGGGMLVVAGILAALLERAGSGKGQVVDAAMVDGCALLATSLLAMAQDGSWVPEREANVIDGGAHFYDTYECSDGAFVSVAPIEERFYAELLRRLGLDPQEWPHDDRARWPELSARLADIFRTGTRAHWCSELEGTDACFAPVLTLSEAAAHPHNVARGTYREAFGTSQPAPAPRFSRTPGAVSRPPRPIGADTTEVLEEWGFGAGEIARLRVADASE